MKGTTQTPFVSNPQLLEWEGSAGFLSVLNTDEVRITAMRLVDKNGRTIRNQSDHVGPVALEFSYEESTQHFYHFHVITSNKNGYSNQDRDAIHTLDYSKVCSSLTFNWQPDPNNANVERVSVLLFEINDIDLASVRKDKSGTYWSKFCSSAHLLLLAGISAFISALNDNRRVLSMLYERKGDEIAVGFSTEPANGGMQTLYFSVFYGEESCITALLGNQEQILHRYSVISEFRVPDWHCNPAYLRLYKHKNNS